jgi:hypothetical protein
MLHVYSRTGVRVTESIFSSIKFRRFRAKMCVISPIHVTDITIGL